MNSNNNESGNKIAQTLHELRKSKKLTQKDVGEHLSITRQAYSNYENNKRTPDLNTLCLLAELFDVSLDYLVRNKSDTVFETPGPYYSGIDIKTGETYYLNEKEKKLLDNYRKLNQDTQKIVDGFMASQTNLTNKNL